MLMNGITASVASASRQSRTSSRIAVPPSSQRALRERRDAVGHELVDRLDVVRHPADEDAGAVPLVEAEREALEVAEELLAEVGEDPFADPAGHVRLDVRHAPVREPGERRRRRRRRQRLRAGLAVDARRRARTSRGRAARARSPSRRAGRRRRGRCARGTAWSAATGHSAAVASCSTTSPRPRAAAAPRDDLTARLVDAHHATSSTSARASTASANCRSSRPCS